MLLLFFKNQLGLFTGAGPRRPVMAPGSRGGHFHMGAAGDVRYGEEAKRPFRLASPHIGETRSGKTIPHPDDPSAQVEGTYHRHGRAFRGWSSDDHRDAVQMHRRYEEHHRARGNSTLADLHAHAAAQHAYVVPRLTKADVGADERPPERYLTIHTSGPEAPGHTVRIQRHPKKPGCWRVHPEDCDRVRKLMGKAKRPRRAKEKR